MRIDHLRSFVTLCDEKNFTKASELLYMTQSNLTKQIKALEADVGHKLLQRTTRTVTLTPEGEAFLPHARAAILSVDEGLSAVRETIDRARATLKIGGDHLNFNPFATDTAAAFTKLHPEYRIEFSEVGKEKALGLLKRGTLDGAYLALLDTAQITAPLSYLTIEVLGDKVLVGPTHPWAKRTSISKEDLRGSTLLFAGRMPNTGTSPALRDLETSGISASIQVVDFEGSMLRMVEHGQGVAIIPEGGVVKGYDLIEVPYESEAHMHGLFVWNGDRMNGVLERYIDYLNTFELPVRNCRV